MTPSLPAPESVRPPCRRRWRRFLPRGNGPGDSVGGDTSGAAGAGHRAERGTPGPCPRPPGGLNPGLRRGAWREGPGLAPAAHRQALRAEAPARPPGQGLARAHLASAIFVWPRLFLSFFFLLFICYNYRFTGSCKNGTERFPTPFIRFPLEVVPHITSGRCHGREPTRGQRLCAVPRRFITHSFV